MLQTANNYAVTYFVIVIILFLVKVVSFDDKNDKE